MSDAMAAPENEQAPLRRRGLIAGSAALAVSLLARSTTERVEAANGDPLRVGQTTTTQLQTSLSVVPETGQPPVSPPVSPAFFVYNSTVGVGIRAQTSGYAGQIDPNKDGMQGFSVGSGNTGVLGRNDDLNAVGVFGVASNGTGVAGQSTGGSAISGNSTSGNGGNFVSSSGNGLFVSSGSGFGIVANSANNPAVYGASTNSIGVQGIGNGAQPYGVVGTTSTPGGFGLLGQASANGSVAFSGTSYNPSALAGQFVGTVTHYGSIILQQQTQPPSGTVNAFVVGPGVSKNAAVRHPDGTHRLLHCVEAPEPWFEDFGEAAVSGGRAEVRIDPDFAAVVDMGKMHVFLTETGSNNALHVARKSATGFTVEADATAVAARGRRMGDVNGTFSYRVVAKRKDVSGERLAKFTFPAKIEVKEVKTPAPPPSAALDRRADGKSSREK